MVPAATGVPAGMPVCSAAAGVTSPTTSAGQSSRGSGRSGATSAAQSSTQRPVSRSYIGCALAGRVVVEHVLAGQPQHHEGARHQQHGATAPTPRARAGAASPAWARPPGWSAGIRSARGCVPARAPDRARRSRLGPGVDPVQNRRPQRASRRIGDEHARPDPAHAHRAQIAGATIHQQLASDAGDLLPPHRCASCSNHPGRGIATAWGRTAVAITLPSHRPARPSSWMCRCRCRASRLTRRRQTRRSRMSSRSADARSSSTCSPGTAWMWFDP